MSILLVIGLPLALFALTSWYFMTRRSERIVRRDKAYWKALNVPWSLVTILSFVLLAFGAYQAEQRQALDLARWKVNIAKESMLAFADASELKWCAADSSDRVAVRSLQEDNSLDTFCAALHQLQQLSSELQPTTNFGSVLQQLESVRHPMIPRHELISVTIAARKLQSSLTQMRMLQTPLGSTGFARWMTLVVACVFAVAAAVRVATVYAEWKIQVVEDEERLRASAAIPIADVDAASAKLSPSAMIPLDG
jgi:hypothetical protein